MTVTPQEIESYLSDVKCAVSNDRYRIARNSRRQDNENLFLQYIIDENSVKDILLSLTVEDFSDIHRNEHPSYEDELLYIFGKEVPLIERFNSDERIVPLYIKFNKLGNNFVVVISFHEQKYPLKYYFK